MWGLDSENKYKGDGDTERDGCQHGHYDQQHGALQCR